MDDISLIIGGEAGDGVKKSGVNLGKILMRAGLHVFVTDEYESLIRGGHSFAIVRASSEPVFSQTSKSNILIAFDKGTIDRHKGGLVKGGIIIYDEELGLKEKDYPNLVLCPLPMKKLVQENKLPDITKNSIALGAVVSLICLDIKLLETIIRETLHSKVEENIMLAREGYKIGGKENYCLGKIKTNKSKDSLLISGNDAIALGAIKAGMKFYAAYPMTPVSPILHYLAKVQRDANIVVFQPESELAAINTVVGASYAGIRAMTGTSGGGFCLMVEGLGLAAMTECPVVVVLGMRPGPSTGLATYTAQTELRFALHASQGEFPRILVAPGDPDECLHLTFDMFNLAEKFQVPAIILTDKYLAESYYSIAEFDTKGMKIDRGKYHTSWKGPYKRYEDSKDGVSPYVVPGTKGIIVKANSNSHNEWGYADEDGMVRTKSIDRWMRKLERMHKEIAARGVKTYGPKKADITVIGWGSTKGPILQALSLCEDKGIKANYIQVVFMSPFPFAQLKPLLSNASKTLIVENNRNSQLGSLLREALCFQPTQHLLKDDGRPFNPEEISGKIEVMARGK